jgi:SAM-dependent methyltransferase
MVNLLLINLLRKTMNRVWRVRMNDNSSKPYLEPYVTATREMGAGFEAQLWMSRDAQKTRFETLIAMGRFEDRVVVDLGCGQGDLPIYIHEHHSSRFPKSYIGIEGVEPMADHARTRVADVGIHRCVFEFADFVEDESLAELMVQEGNAEVFVFSGSLNTLDINHAQVVLDRFWSALVRSGRGTLVFNFLSDRHDQDRTPATAPAVRFDPAKMLDWALERSPIVDLRHAYLKGHDATIVMDVV